MSLKLHDWFKSYNNFSDTKCVFTQLILLNILLLQFTKVESQFNQLQKDSLGKSNEITLVYEFSILAQKL